MANGTQSVKTTNWLLAGNAFCKKVKDDQETQFSRTLA